MVMDAEAPDFPDEEFDVIVSRNLTWTLPDAEHAYQEWFRVLKPGGVMINLDANYGAADFADTADLPENHAHHQIQDELMQEWRGYQAAVAHQFFSASGMGSGNAEPYRCGRIFL